MGKEAIEETLRELPPLPGVYLMKKAGGLVIYVGKAKSLRSRVRSYFARSASHSQRIGRMVSEVDHIEFIMTRNEVEALILECNLIKKHKPPFNVILRDDKHYPYLKLATNDPFPYLAIVRRVKKDGASYYGPYTSAKSLRDTLKWLHRIFKLRQSRDPLDGKVLRRPCLNHQMGLCHAPCAGLISREDYKKISDEVALFLRGRNSELVHQLREAMSRASKELRFEEAARFRDQLRSIEGIMAKQSVISVGLEDRDIVGLAREGALAALFLLYIRGGKVIGDGTVMLKNTAELEDHEILAAYVTQHYSRDVFIPEELILGAPLAKEEGVESWLRERRGKGVKVLFPQRGQKKELLALAEKNARTLLQRELRGEEKNRDGVKDLKERLGLKKFPNRMEAFDISIITGGMGSAVGSMAVFVEGAKASEEYRRFRIRSVKGPDDYAMMREVLTRRFRKVLEGEEPPPDLIVIDGGKGQVGVAREVLEDLDLGEVELVGVAKGKDRENPDTDEIHFPDNRSPLLLPRHSLGRTLLQQLRDEAHRFAISYHRNLRQKESFRSSLDEIEGVGAKRKKELLLHFGSVKGVREASEEEIMTVLKVGRKTAQAILDGLG